jgi:hypothetical protein
MEAIEAATVGLLILGLMLMLVGWFLVVRDPKEDHYSIGALGILLPFLAPWVISAIHYRDLKGAFWIQTIGASLVLGGALL